MSVNKVILVGRLGADPELRSTVAGTPVCNLRLATNRRWRADDGRQEEETCWHRIVVWGKQGESCASYLRKGRQVYVEGRIRNDSYTDKEGIKRYKNEVVSNRVVFLSDGARASEEPALGAMGDDLPF